jgi:hypothetical protein
MKMRFELRDSATDRLVLIFDADWPYDPNGVHKVVADAEQISGYRCGTYADPSARYRIKWLQDLA